MAWRGELLSKKFVGDALVRARISRKITLRELTDETELTGIGKNESGKQAPSWETLVKIAGTYEIPVWQLVSELTSDIEKRPTLEESGIEVMPEFAKIYRCLNVILQEGDAEQIAATLTSLENAAFRTESMKKKLVTLNKQKPPPRPHRKSVPNTGTRDR